MNFRAFLYFSVFFILSSFIKSYGQEDCSLRKDEEGIKVYLCESEFSPFKTIKVYFETVGTIKSYASGVLNIEGYKKWQNSIIHIEILKKINDQELIYYSEVDAPWPISNRDLIFHLKLSQDPASKVLTVTLKQLPDYIPEKEGIVRLPSAESILTVTPIGNDHLKVSYILNVDPGGEVPPFLANMFAANTPWHTFNNFKNLLESHKFIEKKLPNIHNFTE